MGGKYKGKRVGGRRKGKENGGGRQVGRGVERRMGKGEEWTGEESEE